MHFLNSYFKFPERKIVDEKLNLNSLKIFFMIDV